MREKIQAEIGSLKYALEYFMSLYPTPLLAFKEYVTNAVEAGLRSYFDQPAEGNHSTVNVLINKKQGVIIVEDDGRGISTELMRSLPKKICDSVKRGHQTAGEKALGILAFGSAKASQVELYSVVPELQDEVNYLLIQKGRGEFEFEKLDTSKLKYGPLRRGTRVVLSGFGDERVRKNSEQLIEAYYSPGKLIQFLSETYAPFLRKGLVDIIVTNESGGKSKSDTVKPPVYEGEVVMDQILTLDDVVLKDGTRGKSPMELHLFVNPKGKIEKVGHYNWGVRVLPSIAQSLLPISRSLWESGRLSGEVIEYCLRLAPQRNAVDMSDTEVNPVNLEKVIDRLLAEEPYIGIQVQKLKQQHDKHELDSVMKQMLRAFDAIIDDMDRSGTLVKGKNGDQKKNVSKTGAKGYPEGEKGRTPRTTTEETPGMSTGGGFPILTENPLGPEEPVRRGVRFGTLYNYDISPFRVEEEGLRSSLDKNLHMIRINSAHAEYVDAESASEKARDRHLAFLIAKERAQEAFENMVEGNTALPSDYRKLTEIAAEMYYRVLKLLGLQD